MCVAGHSVGGAYALAYAMDHPADVAGVALIDSTTPYQFDLSWYPNFYSVARRASGLLPPLARSGIVRLYIHLAGSSLPGDAESQAQTFASSPRELSADRVEFAELPTVLRQDKALKSLDGKPLFVLTAGVRAGIGMVRRPRPTGNAVDEQRPSDSAARDARGAAR